MPWAGRGASRGACSDSTQRRSASAPLAAVIRQGTAAGAGTSTQWSGAMASPAVRAAQHSRVARRGTAAHRLRRCRQQPHVHPAARDQFRRP